MTTVNWPTQAFPTGLQPYPTQEPPPGAPVLQHAPRQGGAMWADDLDQHLKNTNGGGSDVGPRTYEAPPTEVPPLSEKLFPPALRLAQPDLLELAGRSDMPGICAALAADFIRLCASGIPGPEILAGWQNQHPTYWQFITKAQDLNDNYLIHGRSWTQEDALMFGSSLFESRHKLFGKLLSAASKGRVELAPLDQTHLVSEDLPLSQALHYGFKTSNVEPRIVSISVALPNRRQAHAMVAIQTENGNIQLYDPNVGLSRAVAPQDVNTAFRPLFSNYQSTLARPEDDPALGRLRNLESTILIRPVVSNVAAHAASA